tara:strand:+ start:27 stop:359 length:333 start_codon:yes stop_codon:yes gene_type:complete
MDNTTQKTQKIEDVIGVNGKWIDINSLSQREQEIVRRHIGDDGGISDFHLWEEFEEMLNECYPEIEIGYNVFYAGETLKAIDPLQFRMGAEEYNDSMAEDIIDEAEEVEQ